MLVAGNHCLSWGRQREGVGFQRTCKAGIRRLEEHPRQFLATGHGWECWEMLQPEKDRLFNLLSSLQVLHFFFFLSFSFSVSSCSSSSPSSFFFLYFFFFRIAPRDF